MFKYFFRDAIHASGKTYRQLSNETDINLSTLVRLGQAQTSEERNVTLRTVDTLCRVLQCRPERLVRYVKRK
jgi:DNA-binding Xre family transcriptional regulator